MLSISRKNPEKIFLINQDDRGLLIARRVCFTHAQGAVIVSVDRDDALRADASVIIDRTFRETQAQIVCYKYTRDITLEEPDKDQGLFTGQEICEENRRILYELICGTYFFNDLWSKAISCDVIGVQDNYFSI